MSDAPSFNASGASLREALPTVVILGRPNVGKSSLFNRLAGSRIAIEDPRPGTTRDRVSFEYKLEDRVCELVDAAGIGMIDEDKLEEHIELQLAYAMEQADVVMVVVDVKAGLLPLDEKVANAVRRLNKPVILLANKADEPHFDDRIGVFFKLGLGDPLPVSARSPRGIKELKSRLLEALPPATELETLDAPAMKLAIVGKRNSGKSSLVNLLANDERCIVSEVAGTTRDSVDVRFQYKGMEFMAIDTAGIQRDRSVANSVEFFSQARSIKAIRRADVSILLMDCLEQTSKLDRKLVETALFELKPVIIGVNKWDLAGDVTEETFMEYIEAKLPMINFAPVVFCSVKNRENCFELIDLALELHRQTYNRVGTGELNRVVQDAFQKHRPKGRFGKPPRLFYATQVGVAPPEIVCFVNDSAIFNDAWREYLKRRLRLALPFSQVPLKVVFRNRERIELE